MTEDQADRASLRILFGTAGEARPTYGLDMHELQFEPMSTSMRTFLLDRIKTAIPSRITICRWRCKTRPARRHAADRAGHGARHQLALQPVYPFYWNATEVSVPGGGGA
jgi:hypothetical protein